MSGKAAVDDLTRLLAGASAALVVVDGSGGLSARLLSAGRETEQQVLITLRPGGALAPSLRELVVSSSAGTGTRVRAVALPWGGRGPDLVVLSTAEGSRETQLTLTIASGLLTGDAPEGCVVSLEVDRDAGWDVQQWFLEQWTAAVPFSADLPDPPAWPVVEASPAALEWQSFMDRFSDFPSTTADVPGAGAGQEVEGGFVISQEREDTSDVEPPGGPTLLTTADRPSVVAVVRPPSIERDVKAVYGRGWLVTVNVSQKVPSYRLDVAAVLGLPARSSRGPASASSAVQLDLLPVGSRASIDPLRGEATRILNRHAFTLDENQRWMTCAAYEHFLQRLEAMPRIENLTDLLGLEIPAFVEREIDSWVDSLNRVLAERRLDVRIGAEEAERLRCAANEYLSSRATVAVRASSTREALTFLGGDPESYQRPLRLVLAAAKVTRTRLAAPGSGAKRETEGPPLGSLDVVGGDGLLHEEPDHDVRRAAQRQLRELSQLEAAGLDPMTGCEAVLSLLRSRR